VTAVRIGPVGTPAPHDTLGWEVIDWQWEFLRQPDGPDAGQPWEYTPEQVRFLLWWYAIDDRQRWTFRRGVFRRMKGHGKDPFAASLAATEFVGPCRPGGRRADGSPVAIPHTAPWVQVAAVSRDQTRNTMTLMAPLFADAAISDYSIDLGKEIIYGHRGRARIEAVTSSPRALEGGRPTFVIANETHHWIAANEGTEMAKAIARNLAKSRGGTARSLAITNAHAPGEGSVAEADWEAYLAIASGRSSATGFLYDSLEADPGTDMADPASLMAGLLEARGDSHWLDVERLMDEIYDPSTPASMSRRFYLNQIVAAEDAWVRPDEWAARADLDRPLLPGDVVTLGFDGSVRDDSTALVACRVADGHLSLLGCWERPVNAGDGWQVDRVAVDAAVFEAFADYTVVGMYCDPPHWQDYVDRWMGEFGDRLKVAATTARPMEWWTNRPGPMVAALARLHDAVTGGTLTHDGHPVLGAHVVNARRRIGRMGVSIGKENPVSRNKIDAAMAATLAYEARADAISTGVSGAPERSRSRRLHRF
jgi:phage terminase large subunit-like protein